jgi:hypothetical protein
MNPLPISASIPRNAAPEGFRHRPGAPTVQQNLHLVNAEVGLLAVTGFGLFVELSRRAHFLRTHPELRDAESI